LRQVVLGLTLRLKFVINYKEKMPVFSSYSDPFSNKTWLHNYQTIDLKWLNGLIFYKELFSIQHINSISMETLFNNNSGYYLDFILILICINLIGKRRQTIFW